MHTLFLDKPFSKRSLWKKWKRLDLAILVHRKGIPTRLEGVAKRYGNRLRDGVAQMVFPCRHSRLHLHRLRKEDRDDVKCNSMWIRFSAVKKSNMVLSLTIRRRILGLLKSFGVDLNIKVSRNLTPPMAQEL